jgi:hypothetical protein
MDIFGLVLARLLCQERLPITAVTPFVYRQSLSKLFDEALLKA